MVELDKFFFETNSWSYTRHRVWNRCQRQYYFDYIAQYVKSATVVPPEKIRWLRNFTSRFVVQGQLIHDIIDRQIELHCENRPVDPAEAMNALSKKVSLYKSIGGETFTEYHNGEKITDSFFAAIDENGKACLKIFFESIWPDYRERGCLRHEEYDHFRTGDVEVTVRVDFVSRDSRGTIVITDWKTGRESAEAETELQMAAYVLWAKQYYRKSADEIKSELVFLTTGKKKPYAFFEEQLHEVQETIRTDFEAMNASYEYGDFPARPSQRECLSCRFAEVCPEAAIGKK
jgi:CRISPR/Cas system-associated exonuclease Cas4 (RecB family)